MFAIAALLLTATNPWAGCEVEGPSAGVELRAVCDKAWVSVTVDKPSEAGTAAMLEIVDAIVMDGPASSDGTKELKIAGKAYPARQYRPKDTWGYVVLLPVGADRVRMAQCEEKREGKCLKLFAALAEKLPAVTKKSAENPLRFGESAITVGQTCRSPAPARVECGASALTWSHFPLGEEGIFEVSVNALEAGLARIGKVSRSNLDCVVAEAKTRCALLTISKPDGKEVFTVFGVGATGKEQVVAQCNTAAAIASALPPPCDQAISLGAK